MFHFRTSEEYVRRIFEQGFSARDIAVSLVSFDNSTSASEAKAVMDQYDFDVIGVRVQGVPTGYAMREDLSEGSCGDHMVPFNKEEVLPGYAPLINVMKLLDTMERVFIRVLGEVGGLVTRSDLQKAPVRMWLFGLVTMTEMAMTRFIECRYPDDGWRELLTKNRLSKAEELLKERTRRNQAIDLLDCLQFSDKGQIMIKDPEAKKIMAAQSRNEKEETIKKFESLRNNLAHSQDIVTNNWKHIVELAENMDQLLGTLKQLIEHPPPECHR